MENKKIFAPNHQEKACFKGFLCVFAILLILSALCFSAGAKATTVEVGIPVEEHPELFLNRSMPTHGEGKIAVFLIDFPDYRNDNPYATVDFYDKLYFSGGLYTDWSGWHDSVADFYYDQSYGKLKLSGKVFDWYTAKHERSYYDNRKFELILEAAEYYISQGVDFSQFDGDGDGVIDSLVYHFAGEYEMSDFNDPWYSGVNTSGFLGEIDDLTVLTMIQVYDGAYNDDHFTGDSRILATICHELMHSLGLPDLYSLYEESAPTWDLMSLNLPTINPYFKILLGWVEEVQILTENTTNVHLDVYNSHSAGDVAIVTDKYNGLYEEFIIVAFRNYRGETKAVAWYIDARLNEHKTGFKYSNLFYDPRPDILGAHEPTHETSSPYLFVEELDSDPFQNYIGYNTFTQPSGFGKNDIIGPDSMPSTDTHDGQYTGIKIFNFEEHNGEYLTFDVAFVNDTSSPIVITTESDLNFVETIKIHLNEHVYKGTTFDSIKVTDPQGNPLDVKIILPHYPRNEIEITFNDDSYLDGYKVVFPAGCLIDSSGNAMKEILLYASRENYISPVDSVQLVSAGKYTRSNDYAQVSYFSYNDSVVIIQGCWEESSEGFWKSNAVIEFMRLDLTGNVLTQKYIPNPCENCILVTAYEMPDGHYLLMCTESLIFCIDSNGNLKWTNDSYLGSGISFYYGFSLENEIVLRTNINQMFHLDTETGNIQTYTPNFAVDLTAQDCSITDISDGKLLVQTIDHIDGTKIWQILDTKTNQVTARIEHKCDDFINDYGIFDLTANNDGTYLIRYKVEHNLFVGLLDAELNIVKSVLLSKDEANPLPPIWFTDDGFYHPYYTEKTFHNENKIHIRRYDRHLNFIWEAELTANFIHFFKSPSGDIMAYRSQLYPERECYIDNYGNEDARKPPHTHILQYKEVKPATCSAIGYTAHWACSECGVKFSDEGNTLITDIKSILIPIADHTFVEWIDQCDGTHASRCSCGHTIIDQHSYVDHKCACGQIEYMNITFMNGTEIWHQDRAEYNTLLNVLGMPVPTAPTGSVFVGWYTEDGTQVEQGMIVTDHIVAYAKYVVIDIDGNGTAEKKDANTIIQYIVGTNDSVNDPTALDLNSDGKVTVVDAVMLLLYLAGKTNLTN